jgi:hypothetical protein
MGRRLSVLEGVADPRRAARNLWKRSSQGSWWEVRSIELLTCDGVDVFPHLLPTQNAIHLFTREAVQVVICFVIGDS